MNMNKLMKQAQKMQADLANAQEAVAKLEVKGSAGGGAVQVTLAGDHTIKNLEIDPDLAKDDIEMLQDMVIAAINNAVQDLAKQTEDKMGSVTGGMPGMPGLF